MCCVLRVVHVETRVCASVVLSMFCYVLYVMCCVLCVMHCETCVYFMCFNDISGNVRGP